MVDMVEFIEEKHPQPPALTNSWPVGLSVEVALDELTVGEKFQTEEELAQQFDITVERLRQLKQHPAFRAEVRAHMSQIKEDGASIRRKAKVILEQYLDYKIHDWLKEPGVSLDSRTKLLSFVSKLSGVESAGEAAKAQQNQQVASVPSINITLTTATPIQAVPTLERVVN